MRKDDEMGNLSLGQLRRRDIGLAARFAAAGMHFDEYLASPLLQRLYARYFFLDELRRATQIFAAYDGDELAGVLLADIEGEPKQPLALPDRLYCGFAHAVQHVFFRGAEDAYDEANREMLADFRKQHDDIAGEICFLAADPFHKRKGTGSFLLSELERREEGKRIFLYTGKMYLAVLRAPGIQACRHARHPDGCHRHKQHTARLLSLCEGPGRRASAIDYREVAGRIGTCEALLDSMYAEIARSYGLTYNALMVFCIMADEADVIQKTITDELHLAKSMVHSIVESLAAQSYIAFSERKIGKEKVLVLTESGSTFAGKVMDTVHERERKLLDALGEDACEELLALADRFIGCFESSPAQS